MAQGIPLNKVPKDHSPINVKSVYNPLSEDFYHKFDGEEQVIPSGERVAFPENVAVLLAKHLAKKIVMTVAEKERAAILRNMESSKHIKMSLKPYPRFDFRAGEVAKLLIGQVKSETKVSKDEILKVASEENARDPKKIEQDKPAEFKDDVVVADEKKPSTYKEMTRQQMQAEVKARGLDISHTAKNIELTEALLLSDDK